MTRGEEKELLKSFSSLPDSIKGVCLPIRRGLKGGGVTREALRRRLPEARFVGTGGPAMAAAGCELLEEPVRHAAMTGHALAKIPYFRGLVRRMRRAVVRLDCRISPARAASNTS